MEKPLRPDYVYINSEALKQRIAFHKKSGWLFCEDKYPEWSFDKDKHPDGKLVSYSPKELEVIKKSGEPITPEVHLLKKVFAGEVIEYVQTRKGNNNSGKSIEGTKSDNSNNPSNQGGQIQSASGNGTEKECGYFDIY